MDTRVVTSHLPAELAEERHRMTLEALADVDAKHTADHAEIETWVSRLGKPKRARRR